MSSRVPPRVFSSAKVHEAISRRADRELYLLRQTIRRLGITPEMMREIHKDLDR